MRNIVFFVNYGPKIGWGHAFRCAQLIKVLNSQGENAFIYSDDSDLSTKLGVSISTNISDGDILVHDCITDIEEFPWHLRDTHRLIALDYNGNNQDHFNAMIFLIDHFSEKRAGYTGDYYCGTSFSIIKNSVKEASLELTQKGRVTISLGGQPSSSLLSNVLGKLEDNSLDYYLYAMHVDESIIESFPKINFILGKDVSTSIAESEYIICNAGTTSLESLALGHKPYLIHQTWHEKNFKKQLLDDNLAYDFYDEFHSLNSKRSKRKHIDIDGDKRICKIILGEISD